MNQNPEENSQEEKRTSGAMSEQPPSTSEPAEQKTGEALSVTAEQPRQEEEVKEQKETEPTLEFIQRLIGSLSDCALEAPSDGDLPSGDLFICYHIRVFGAGVEPYRIKGTRALHGVLDPSGMMDATDEVESAMIQLLNPIRAHVLKSTERKKDGEKLNSRDEPHNDLFRRA